MSLVGLLPTFQNLSKPFFELTKSDGKNWSGASWERIQNGKEVGVKHKIEEARNIYERLATSICDLIDLPISVADKEKFDLLIKRASQPVE